MVIVVVGASGGLGSYLSEQLAKDYPVIATYYTHKPTSTAPGVEWYQVDVRDVMSIERFVAATNDRLQHIVLVNLAGISLDGMGHKMDEATWDRVLDTNLKGTFLMCRSLLPLMRQQEWGRIINISSVVGQRGTICFEFSVWSQACRQSRRNVGCIANWHSG